MLRLQLRTVEQKEKKQTCQKREGGTRLRTLKKAPASFQPTLQPPGSSSKMVPLVVSSPSLLSLKDSPLSRDQNLDSIQFLRTSPTWPCQSLQPHMLSTGHAAQRGHISLTWSADALPASPAPGASPFRTQRGLSPRWEAPSALSAACQWDRTPAIIRMEVEG